MQASIHSELKLKRASYYDSTYQIKEKLNNTKFEVRIRFYQKLFVIILTLFSFLIIPESPIDSEILCKKYHSEEACFVW